MHRRAKYFDIYFPANEYQIHHDWAWRQQEFRRGRFRHQSPQIDSRRALLEKLKFSAEEMKLTRATLHLCMYFLDYFMDNHNIIDDRLNLVAYTALLVAAKVEEKESTIPRLTDLNSCLERAGSAMYPRNDFKALEKMMLRFLDFEMMVPTSATFCEYYATILITEDDKMRFPLNENLMQKYKYLKNLRECALNLFFDFLDFSLLDCDISQNVPSKTAAACILATRRELGILPLWPDDLHHITLYKYKELINTMGVLAAIRAGSMDENKCSKKSKNHRKSDSGFFTDDSDAGEPSTKKLR